MKPRRHRNTGWVAGPEADTGWRSLDATAFGVDTGKLTLGKCHLRRVGPRPGATSDEDLTGAKVGTSGATIAVVPAGFAPQTPMTAYAGPELRSKLDAGISNVQHGRQINWDSAGLPTATHSRLTCTWPPHSRLAVVAAKRRLTTNP